MLIEGQGIKSPALSSIRLSRSCLLLLQSKAAQRASYRGYAHRSDAWGRGFVKNPILVGLVGEAAVCEFLTRRGFAQYVDLSLRPLGDTGSDVVVRGLRVQVKTRRKGIGRRNLIRRGDEHGRIIPLSCDLFVFCQWNDNEPGIDPQLLGWIWADDARRGCFERSSVAGHWNLRIPDAALLPMSRLVDELSSR